MSLSKKIIFLIVVMVLIYLAFVFDFFRPGMVDKITVPSTPDISEINNLQ